MQEETVNRLIVVMESILTVLEAIKESLQRIETRQRRAPEAGSIDYGLGGPKVTIRKLI